MTIVVALNCVSAACMSHSPQVNPTGATAISSDNPTELFPNRETHAVTATVADGAWASVKTPDGYVIELSIPPAAVRTDLPITLRLSSRPNPLKHATGPVFEIVSSDATIGRGALIRVHPPVKRDLKTVRVFDVTLQDRITPSPMQVARNGVVYANLKHFSDYAVGMVSLDQLRREVDQLISLSQTVDPSAENEMREMVEVGDALMQLAEMASLLGADQVASEYYDNLGKAVERTAEAALAEARPQQPCESYLTTLLQFGRLVGLYAIGGDISSRFKRLAIDVLSRCPGHGRVEVKIVGLSGVGAPDCGIFDAIAKLQPPRFFQFSEQGGSFVGGKLSFLSEYMVDFLCNSQPFGKMTATFEEDIAWTARLLIKDPFDVRFAFDIVTELHNLAAIFEKPNGDLAAPPIFTLEQSGSGYTHIAFGVLARDDQGNLQGIGLPVQSSPETTALEFPYVDGAMVEITSHGTPFAVRYILKLTRG